MAVLYSKKLTSIFMSTLMIVSNIVTPMTAFAETVVKKSGNVTVNVEVHANERTLGWLDAQKFVNVSNINSLDFKPSIDGLLDDLPENKFADIVEYEGFGTDVPRNNFVSEGEYSSKLNYLIENNIISRDYSFIYSNKGIQTNLANAGVDWYNDPDSDKAVSKSTFVSHLIKTGDPIQGRLLMVRAPYKRVDENYVVSAVEREPIELSPYQKYMSDLGIDSVNNDIIVSHKVYGETHIAATNDVYELYLERALGKGIISKEELNNAKIGASGGFESYKNNSPVRQFYQNIKLSGKEFETGRVEYPKGLEEYYKVMKSAHDYSVEVNTNASLTGSPWGDGYKYLYTSNNKVVPTCIFENPFSAVPITILKKAPKELKFFKDEGITQLEAYVYAYKYLKSSNLGKNLTKEEVDYLTSTYASNLGTMSDTEKEAVNYLIAMGVLDGKSELYKSSSTSLDNKTFIDLIYKIHNKDSRLVFNPVLTETDKEMLKRGYSQATVSMVENDISPSVEVHFGDTSMLVDDINNIDDIIEEDVKTSPEKYTLIGIRVPKPLTESSDYTTRLYVDDKYRSIIAPNRTVELKNEVWNLYYVSKGTGGLVFTGEAPDTTYTYSSISGAGFYFLPDNVKSGVPIRHNKKTPRTETKLIQEYINKEVTKNPEDAIGDLIASGPATTKTGEIRIGPWEKDLLPYLKIDGKPLFKEMNGDYVLVTGLPKKYEGRLKLLKADGKYYVSYVPQAMTDYEHDSLLKSITQDYAGTDKKFEIPGYIKSVGSQGNTSLLISDAELDAFGIVKLSDKTLMNKKTGQRAFLNTDDSIAIIGNNITQYPKGTMMVQLNDKKLFYSFDIVKELLNDMRLMQSRAGSSIFTSSSQLEYKTIPIRDVETNSIIDTTYRIPSKDGQFINMSAMTGRPANFIRVVNKGAGLSMLIVYKPKTTSVKPPSSVIDNSLDKVVNLSVKPTGSTNTTRDAILNKIFLKEGSTGDENDILLGDYQFNVYLLNEGDASADTKFNLEDKFYEFVSGSDTNLKAEIKSYIAKQGDVKLNVLEVGKQRKFMIDEANNLYFKIQNLNNTANKELNSITGNNFFLPTDRSEIKFRSQKYFTNTPVGEIPLEVYAENPYKYRRIEINKPDLNNFGLKPYKFTSGILNNNVQLDGKLNGSKVDTIGEFSVIQLEVLNIKTKTLTDKEILYGPKTVNSLEKVTTIEEFDNFLYNLTIKLFNEKTPGLGDQIHHAHTTSTVGYLPTIPDEYKREHFESSWKYANIAFNGRKYDHNFKTDLVGKNAILYSGSVEGKGEEGKYALAYNSAGTMKTDTFGSTRQMSKIRSYDKILYKPTITVPAGSFVVKADGTMTYKPNDERRSEIFAFDILNSMLSRMSDVDTYLFEIPQYAKVVFPKNDITVIKMTQPNDKNLSKALSWVPSLYNTGVSYDVNDVEVTDYDKEFTKVGNIYVPYNDAEGSKVAIKDIVANGKYDMPSISETEKALQSASIEDVGFKIGSKVILKVRDTVASTNVSSVKLEVAKIYQNLKGKGIDANSALNGNKGNMVMNVILPPTLKVIPVGGTSNTYEVVGYADISRFTTDPDNSLVKYFQSKDTKVKSNMEILASIRAMSFDGSKYKKYAETKSTMTTFHRFTNFVEYGVPILILIVWIYMTLMFVLAYFPMSRNALIRMAEDTGSDLLSRLSFGFLCLSDENPSFKQYCWVSFLMFTTAIVFNTIIADFIIAIGKFLAAFWYTMTNG